MFLDHHDRGSPSGLGESRGWEAKSCRSEIRVLAHGLVLAMLNLLSDWPSLPSIPLPFLSVVYPFFNVKSSPCYGDGFDTQ